jgi:glycine cleavage system protein P-like pyridoxal-binding family
MAEIDTSAEAVARICQLIDHNIQWVGLQNVDREAYREARYIIRTLAAERDRLAAEIARLRVALQNIVDSYEASSELHTSSADCAGNLYDHACKALGQS